MTTLDFDSKPLPDPAASPDPLPATPLSSDIKDTKKKSNPLNDLVDSEKAYVDQLTGIIRKVAAAWSRSNLPPPDLDAMFRSIEGVYKANRTLHSKLKDIAANPSSPKALGDLLMRWIDDLKGPYTTYCTKYRCGFDIWEPVQSNPKLAGVLSTFSATNPPPSSAAASTSPPTWTLDDLFLIPKARLRYYKKLYGRLLKSTAPGRSDHRLLVGAIDTLDNLLETLETRSSVKVGNPISPPAPTPPVLETEDEVVIDLRTQSVIQEQSNQNDNVRTSADVASGSQGSSTRTSSVSAGSRERSSRETAMTSVSQISSAALSMPVSELERRLSTQRTLDIFTMKPKVVRLQMNPPTLTFTREMRFSVDVVIRFIPQSTGVEVVHTRGHIFLLSDLFLICERISPEERSQAEPGGADMWLGYPPLAGKVLRVFDIPEQPKALKVTIMRKETLILETESVEVRNFVMSQFKECIEFAGTLPPPSKQLPPPVPALNGMGRSRSAPLDRNPSLQQAMPPPVRHNTTIPASNRPSSPSQLQRNTSAGGPSSHPQPPPYQNLDRSAVEGMSNLVLSPEAQIQQGAQRVPSMHDPLPGPMYPRSSSAQPFPNGGSPYPNGQPYPNNGQPFPNGPPSGQQGMPPRKPGVPQGLPPRPGPGQYGPPSNFQQPMHPNNQPFLPNRPGPSPYGLPPGAALPPSPGFHSPPRSPSDPGFQGGIRKSLSTRSLASQYQEYNQAPPLPALPDGYPPNPPNPQGFIPRNNSFSSLRAPQPRPVLPSLQFNSSSRSVSMAEPSFDEPSPPNSPVEETPQPTGPVTSTVSAQMKCKVFLQQQHAQWKSLGSAKLKLYRQDPTNIKQLVVEADSKDKAVVISTIVLTDGVERVGKTGVAIELSDQGRRTGIIYMIQLRNEKSAGGLFDSLLAGSDRAARG